MSVECGMEKMCGIEGCPAPTSARTKRGSRWGGADSDGSAFFLFTIPLDLIIYIFYYVVLFDFRRQS